MGNSGSVVWHANADSISRPGEKAVVTDPIEGLTSEQVFKLMEQFVRERPLTAAIYEVDRELKDHDDGGLLEVSHIEVKGGVAAAVMGELRMSFYTLYYFRHDKGELEMVSYAADATLQRKVATSLLKASSDPFRLEVLADEFSYRKSGHLLAGMMTHRLKQVGMEVKVAADAPSGLADGQLSAISDPIEGMTSKALWDKISAQMEETEEGTKLPDDSIVVEQSFTGGLVGANYFKHFYDEKEDTLCCMDFGADESMETCRTMAYWKVDPATSRVEAWAITQAGRRAGEASRKIMEEMLNSALKLEEEKKKG